MSRALRLWILVGVCIVAIIGMAAIPAIPQPPDYHNFADDRTEFGIPNFWNVASNLPFLFVGIVGLVIVLKGGYAGGLPRLRLAYGVFFAGVALVCFGSGYYHWSPSNTTLAWDRLPMSIAFMAFVSIMVGEFIDEATAMRLLWPLVVIGIFSVWYWDYTEGAGNGDLRLYGLVQFLSLAIIALTLFMFPSRLTGAGYIWAMFGGYALAKVLEIFDAPIYEALGRQMSGHALKHLAAAAGMYFFIVALKKRDKRHVTSQNPFEPVASSR